MKIGNIRRMKKISKRIDQIKVQTRIKDAAANVAKVKAQQSEDKKNENEEQELAEESQILEEDGSPDKTPMAMNPNINFRRTSIIQQ